MDKVGEYYNCLKVMMKAHLSAVFFHKILRKMCITKAILFLHEIVAIKHNLQKKVIMKWLANKILAWNFKTPNSKNIIATLCIVKIEKTELTLFPWLRFTWFAHCKITCLWFWCGFIKINLYLSVWKKSMGQNK